jgi:hypothetical protein
MCSFWRLFLWLTCQAFELSAGPDGLSAVMAVVTHLIRPSRGSGRHSKNFLRGERAASEKEGGIWGRVWEDKNGVKLH